jgi:hypothetical protein
MKNITLPGAIVIGSVIIGMAFISIQLLKQSSIEKQQQIDLQQKINTQEQASKKESQRVEAEAYNAIQVTSQRNQCLSNVSESARLALDSSSSCKATCDQFSSNSREYSSCVGYCTQSANQDIADYKKEEELCYSRFPVN